MALRSPGLPGFSENRTPRTGNQIEATATIFVTGTDTGVGKTRIACGLLKNARARGLRAAGFKPVAAGAVETAEGLRNDDAMALLHASTPGLCYDEVNPSCFAQPIAPHLAARAAGQSIEPARLDQAYAQLAARHERVVIEGAGGWLVPLNQEQTMADWVAVHGWPVLLVVGIRLGCINHALLSAAAITAGTRLIGWVANLLPPPPGEAAEIVEALRERLMVPLLGVVATDSDAAAISAQLSAVEFD